MTKFHHRYKLGKIIGKGCFGTVHEAESLIFGTNGQDTEMYGTRVAVKLIPIGSVEEGLPRQVVREITAMHQLQRKHSEMDQSCNDQYHSAEQVIHPNIVKLIEVTPVGSNVAIITELCDTNLISILKDYFSPLCPMPMSAVKDIMRMILSGMKHCHSEPFGVMHRDIKTSNILINIKLPESSHSDLEVQKSSAKFVAKISDFGLSRPLLSHRSVDSTNDGHLTHEVATRWYRAPELLLGNRNYDGKACDMWGIGCIFFELLNCSIVGGGYHPLFPGVGDIDQLSRIFNLCGVPLEGSALTKTPDWGKIEFTFPSGPQSSISPQEKFTALFGKGFEESSNSDQFVDAIDLLVSLLSLEASNRISATDALHHKFFS